MDEIRRERVLARFSKENKRLFAQMTSPTLKHDFQNLQSAYQFYNIYDVGPEKAKAGTEKDEGENPYVLFRQNTKLLDFELKLDFS